MTPSVTAPGDTNVNDATVDVYTMKQKHTKYTQINTHSLNLRTVKWAGVTKPKPETCNNCSSKVK